METAEQILDKWLTNYPWQHWGKQNAIKAMNEFAEQQVKLLAAPAVSESLPSDDEIKLTGNEFGSLENALKEANGNVC